MSNTGFQLESHKILKGNLARLMYLNQFAHQLYNILFDFVRRLRGFTFSLVELYFCKHTHQFIKQKSTPFCFLGEIYPKRSINVFIDMQKKFK